MLRWSKDQDFWLRRIAIDHQLGRKEKTNTKLLEKIIVNNFGSKEFFINKAIGWALRDYSKTNPKWVENFINECNITSDNVDDVLRMQVGKTFKKVLEHAGVYKRTPQGKAAFMRFIQSV